METLRKHLIERGMDPSKYPISYDNEEGIITFMLYNGTGSIVGYQQYRPSQPSKQKKNDPKSGRYYTYLPKDTDGVFGLDVLNPEDRTIYIVEGVFKASVLHRLGYNAIAVLTSTPKRLRPWFKILRQTWNLVAIGDNDSAGQKLVNIVKNGFQSPTDLDEMSDEDIKSLLRGCYTP
jgi:DNA primase